MDADQLDLKITGHEVMPGRVLEDGRGPRRLAHVRRAPGPGLADAGIRLDEELAP
jgi:hypothetical protein